MTQQARHSHLVGHQRYNIVKKKFIANISQYFSKLFKGVLVKTFVAACGRNYSQIHN